MTTGITARMISSVADFFSISLDEAKKKRSENLPNFATTLEWLRFEGFTDTEKYFADVHPEGEVDELEADENLRSFLQSIPLQKSVLTNSPKEHAERVLKKLNVADLFGSVIDIRDCNLNGKPYGEAYRIALERAGCDIDNAIFFDDQLKYTDGWELLGGLAVSVGRKNGGRISNAVLAKVEAANAKIFGEKKLPRGKTMHIDSIYEIDSLLQKLGVL